MLVNNPELNNVIDEKLWDAWRHSRNEKDMEWVKRWENLADRQRKYLTPNELERMRQSHFWQTAEDETTEECMNCGLDYHAFYDFPQYCETLPTRLLEKKPSVS